MREQNESQAANCPKPNTPHKACAFCERSQEDYKPQIRRCKVLWKISTHQQLESYLLCNFHHLEKTCILVDHHAKLLYLFELCVLQSLYSLFYCDSVLPAITVIMGHIEMTSFVPQIKYTRSLQQL